MSPTFYRVMSSPTGGLLLVAGGDGQLQRIDFLSEGMDPRAALAGEEEPVEGGQSGPTAAAADQLAEYFEGHRRRFELELAPSGSGFQHEIWCLLEGIPFGETRTYGELAGQLGRPGAARAVGRANATNPIPIVLPCHRVVGADGSLTGYAGGLPIKRALLELEGWRAPVERQLTLAL